MNLLAEDAAIVPEVDPQRPSVSRMYNYFLGGRHHFAADRQAAAAALAAMPELPAIVRLNRRVLRRVVTLAVESGIDQFLDLGAGIPSDSDTREVARELDPASRVIGVDIEPVAFVHGRRVTVGDPAADVVFADLTDAGAVLAAPRVRRVLDLDRPVCVLLVAVGHFLPDTERLTGALERYRTAVAPGSLLALTHGCRAGQSKRVEQVRRLYNNTTAPMVMRNPDEVRALLGDWPLLAPGVVTGGEFCAGSDPSALPDGGTGRGPIGAAEASVADRAFLVGVARKP